MFKKVEKGLRFLEVTKCFIAFLLTLINLKLFPTFFNLFQHFLTFSNFPLLTSTLITI